MQQGLTALKPQVRTRSESFFVEEDLVISIKSENVLFYKRQRLKPKIVTKTAFCVYSDLQFGIARMFQTLLENDKHLIEIFRDKKTAAQWLDIDQEILQEKPDYTELPET